MRKNKVIINFTPTGMIPTKQMTPHVPVTADEIIQEVLEARQFGVSMVHLHARGDDEKPTYKKVTYKEIIDGIREIDKELIIGVSTSGRDWPEIEKRCECFELKGKSKPDMASLTLSSLNFNKQASINTPDTIKALARKMLENDVKPELEVFDVGMINYAKYLSKKNLLKPPYYFNMILGNIACAQADIGDLSNMINKLPANSIWSCGGIGNSQLKMNVNAIINGGGVRIGLEDNIWFDNERTQLATNSTLLERIRNITEALGIKIATPSEVRGMLAI